VEDSGGKTAASLRTFFVWVISARALKSLVAFLGYSCLAAERLGNELAAEAERGGLVRPRRKVRRPVHSSYLIVYGSLN
jgi:hypothetical protein